MFAKNFSRVILMLASVVLPAVAQTNIYSPSNGSNVSSPFTLNMDAGNCSGQQVTAVGYSLDNSTQTNTYNSNQINGPVSSPSGWHTLHVKVWNRYGAVCVTDLTINVSSGPSTTSTDSTSSNSGGGDSIIPSWANQHSDIQTYGNWTGEKDDGTPGWANASMSIQSSPSLTGSARLFQNEFGGYGGYRYWSQFDDNQDSTNFFYDTWVYIAGDTSGIANLEFDLNQTMQNGETVIMGFQCDTWNNSWDFSVNGGSPQNSWNAWQHTGAYCNVHNWGANQWHHVQIWFSHDGNGWVDYHAVWLDGNEMDLNAWGFSGYALGWGPAVVTNFQVDGSSSGTTWSNIYLDNMSVFRW
jgi:hypothetical protein